MRNLKKLCVLLLVSLLAVSLVPTQARAAELIDVARACTLDLRYAYEGQGVPSVTFKLYRLADVDGAGKFTPVSELASFPVNLAGLDLAAWDGLSQTLAGYVEQGGLTPVASGQTGIDGTLKFGTNLTTGLYFVLGESKTINGVVYSTAPAMVPLPVQDANTGDWNYVVTLLPKCDARPQTDEPITRKVLKAWNDNNNAKGKRPQSVTVKLLKDGVLYDTKTLTVNNNWRYEWTNLDANASWSLTEDPVSGYTVTVDLQGVTFLVTNTLIPDKYCEDDPPIKKTITGDTPATDALFRFSLEAKSNTAGLAVSEMPMPAGSNGTIKYKEVYGGGEYEFGVIRFTVPGTYVYEMKELKTGVTGYTYDESTYTVTYEVMDDTSSPTGMRSTRTITKSGATVQVAEFINAYDASSVTPSGSPDISPTATPTPTPGTGPKLPSTGQLWWPIPILLIGGFFLILFGLLRKRKNEDRE